MRKRSSLGIALFIVSLMTSPAWAQEQADAEKAIEKAIQSGLAKGGEAAVRALAGYLYDTDCKTLRGNESICAVLGSFSGRAESEWKDNVTNKLNEIKSQLTAISDEQTHIKDEVSQTHQEMLKAFEQVASKSIAADIEVTIESLWATYTLHFATAVDAAQRQDMVNFARDIVKKKLHTRLGELNTVLTTSVNDGGEPLLRYPLAFYRIRLLDRPAWERDAKLMDAYNVAEKKFLQYRMEQDKAYLLYLWAATVLENDCKVNGGQCFDIPRSRQLFKADFEHYTRVQTETFNAAVDWLILAQSPTRTTSTGAFLPKDSMPILLRANIVTARVLSKSGGGMWGRIYSMGDAWDGKVNATCGISMPRATQLTPVLTYKTPVDGTGTTAVGPKSGPLDWWTSTAKNTNWDVVRFANEWKVYHYSIPEPKPARYCGVLKELPDGSQLPWVQDSTPVVLDTGIPLDSTHSQAPKPTLGSFVAIQRAGGTYALTSGTWDGTRTPEKTYDGPGGRKEEVYDWFINIGTPIGPTAGLLSKARGEFIVGNMSSRIRNRDLIRLQSKKPIQFPDDRNVKLNFFPDTCSKRNICDSPSILRYRVEHGDPGKMTARAAVYFDNGAATNLRDLGVVIDRSYSNATGTKEVNVEGGQVGEVKTERGKEYRLTYLIEFDLETEGSGKEYSYRGVIAPGAVFLTK